MFDTEPAPPFNPPYNLSRPIRHRSCAITSSNSMPASPIPPNSARRHSPEGDGEIVEHGGQEKPTPADHLQIGEVGLPQLIGCRGLVLERIGGLDHDEGRAADQVMRLQQTVDPSF